MVRIPVNSLALNQFDLNSHTVRLKIFLFSGNVMYVPLRPTYRARLPFPSVVLSEGEGDLGTVTTYAHRYVDGALGIAAHS